MEGTTLRDSVVLKHACCWYFGSTSKSHSGPPDLGRMRRQPPGEGGKWQQRDQCLMH